MYTCKDKTIHISENTKHIGKHTFFENGTLHDTNTLLFVYDIVKQIDNLFFIDIGSHCGVFSLLVGQIPNSSVIAFEPNPEVFSCLEENIKLNHIQNIETFNIGLGDKQEEKELNVCIHHSGLSTFGTNLTRFTENTNKKKVQVKTLDDFMFKKIDFIKIDTEGFEYYIIKGGIQNIKKHKPNILLEIYDDNLKQTNVKKEELEYILKFLGYHKTFCIDTENYFFVYFKPTIISTFQQLMEIIYDEQHNNDVLFLSEHYQLKSNFMEIYSKISKIYDILFLEKGNSMFEEKIKDIIQQKKIIFIQYTENKQSIRNTNYFLLSTKCIQSIREFISVFPLENQYSLEEFLDFMSLTLSLKIGWIN